MVQNNNSFEVGLRIQDSLLQIGGDYSLLNDVSFQGILSGETFGNIGVCLCT